MKKLFFFFLLLFLIGCTSNSPEMPPKNLSLNSTLNSCYEELPVKINGNSMYPTLKSNSFVTGQFNYYQCNEIQRGDIVLINITKDKNLHAKFIKAIPGDNFEYKNNVIYINGELLKNSENNTYNISSKMLELYSNSYPVLPEDSYLILGDQESGSFDSSKVGLIGREQIVAKIVK